MLHFTWSPFSTFLVQPTQYENILNAIRSNLKTLGKVRFLATPLLTIGRLIFVEKRSQVKTLQTFLTLSQCQAL